MPAEYSVRGYISAVLRRSSKTILVEGVTDKDAIRKLILNSQDATISMPNIDHADLINESKISGCGNKRKVLEVISELKEIKKLKPEIANKLSTLIDREWDGIDFVDLKANKHWSPPVCNAPHYVTNGHSIENYYISVSSIVGYLKQRFSHALTKEIIEKISDRFIPIIALAIGYSLEIEKARQITRCTSLIKHEHLKWLHGKYVITNGFESALTSRGASCNGIADQINNSVEKYWTDVSPLPFSKWLCHGHLGLDLIWACVANIFTEEGVATQIATQIERGDPKEKEFYLADYTSKLPQHEIHPLGEIIRWTELQ